MDHTESEQFLTKEHLDLPQVPGAGKTWVIRLVLLVIVCLSVGLFGEMAFRFYVFGLDALSIRKINSTGSADNRMFQLAPHREIMYELKPNLSMLHWMVKFETNSLGLRDREYSIDKPIGIFRICVVGDSLTVATGVALEETYHKKLEHQFNQQSRSLSFELINFGVGGYSLRQYAAVIKNKVPQYHPDLILIGYCPWNDGQPNANDRTYWAGKHEAKDLHPPERVYLSSFLYRHVIRRLLSGKLPLASNVAIANGQDYLDLDYLQRYFACIAEVGSTLRLPVVVVSIFQDKGRGYSPDVEAVVRGLGLHFVDASSHFDGADLSRYHISKIDHHPNALANGIFADIIREYLIEHKLVPREAGENLHDAKNGVEKGDGSEGNT
jgi:hypothetical protein